MRLLRRRPPPLGPEPRPHHYNFAHRLFPEVAAASPDLLLATLIGRDGEGYLRHLWQLAGDGLPPEQVLEPVGLELSIETIADASAVVVTLPTPENAIEATYVALVDVQPREGDRRVRYFTLEAGIDLATQRAMTFLCEWDGERHLNHGPAAAPDQATFAVMASAVARAG